MPKISIITPTYKGAFFIGKTIESVRNQSFCDYEHIIINDNSPDNVEQIIQDFQKNDDKIVYIKNENNLGIAGSRNKGLKFSQGEYICFLDHDDVFLDSNKLNLQSHFLDNHNQYGIVSSLVITIDSNDAVLYYNSARETDDDIRSHLLQSNQFLPCAMMLRKQAIIEYGGFDSHYDKSDDYDLRMKIGKTWKMYCLQQYMVGYRVHDSNTSGTMSALYHMRWLSFKIFWKNKGHYPNSLKALILRSIEGVLPPQVVQKLISLLK